MFAAATAFDARITVLPLVPIWATLPAFFSEVQLEAFSEQVEAFEEQALSQELLNEAGITKGVPEPYTT